MSEFEDQFNVCMQLIKQKSQEVSETDKSLAAMKDLLQKLQEEESKVKALKRKRKCHCLYLLLYIVALYHDFNGI